MNHPSINITSNQQHSDPNQHLQATNTTTNNKINHNYSSISRQFVTSISSSPITHISSELSTAKMKPIVNQAFSDSGNSRSDAIIGGAQSQLIQSLQSQQQQQQGSSISQPQSQDMTLPVIQRVEALDVIINFKKHLQDKWKKNRAKQHVNKIIHYHVKHTFFLRYAAPLFLSDYQELLQTNLAKEGPNQTSNGREQGLLATLKQINTDVLNGSKKTKSISVLDTYLSKLEEKDQLSEFLEVLVYILFGEAPCQIPSELNERKKNLFHYVSPIIGFLIIFYIHAEKKPQTLDELVTRSGLKQLYKTVEVPGKDLASTDSKNGNESEEDSEEEQTMEEEENSLPQANSQTLNNNNNNNNNNNTNNSPMFLSTLQQISGKEDLNDDKQSLPRITPQFQDLEKTLQQQKQQQNLQYINNVPPIPMINQRQTIDQQAQPSQQPLNILQQQPSSQPQQIQGSFKNSSNSIAQPMQQSSDVSPTSMQLQIRNSSQGYSSTISKTASNDNRNNYSNYPQENDFNQNQSYQNQYHNHDGIQKQQQQLQTPYQPQQMQSQQQQQQQQYPHTQQQQQQIPQRPISFQNVQINNHQTQTQQHLSMNLYNNTSHNTINNNNGNPSYYSKQLTGNQVSVGMNSSTLQPRRA